MLNYKKGVVWGLQVTNHGYWTEMAVIYKKMVCSSASCLGTLTVPPIYSMQVTARAGVIYYSHIPENGLLLMII